MGEDDIGERVRKLVEIGELPGDAHVNTYTGTGTGKNRCKLCGSLVAEGTPEIELDWGSGGAYANLPVLHPACRQAWLVTLGHGYTLAQ